MANWERAIDDFERKVRTNIVKIHARTAFAMRDSVVDGSPTTGAPGQPVDLSTLKNSWQLTFPSPLLARLVTSLAYAEGIENGVGPHGPITLRSTVGGFHSVKMTRLGVQKVADEAVREVVRI